MKKHQQQSRASVESTGNPIRRSLQDWPVWFMPSGDLQSPARFRVYSAVNRGPCAGYSMRYRGRRAVPSCAYLRSRSRGGISGYAPMMSADEANPRSSSSPAGDPSIAPRLRTNGGDPNSAACKCKPANPSRARDILLWVGYEAILSPDPRP